MRMPMLTGQRTQIANLQSGGIVPHDDPCPGLMHARCNVEAALCLPSIAAGPEAFAACLASVGLSECFCCWFPC
jgi:hypothetical protein